MNDPNTTIPSALRERAAQATRPLVGGPDDFTAALAKAFCLGFTAGLDHAESVVRIEREACADELRARR
jgi:hypothetical protein